ncbi:MFS transporter [Pseudonocardia sp. CA-107938]|uniref:MFS transporter n=1 Tax=Pseudonocardia sp. CA-107938 TaxID=3240021 RepID=UPI003D8AA939
MHDTIRTPARRLANGLRATLHPTDPTARVLTWITGATAFGTGLFTAVSALLFVRGIGLDPSTVGYGLTVAGVVGVAASFYGGRLADRVGTRRTMVAALLVQGIMLCCYALATEIVGFVAIACAVVGAQFAGFSTRQAVIAGAFTGPSRVQVRARLRVVTNVAVGLGTGAAAIALTVDTVAAYRVAVVLAGLTTLVAVLPARRLPRRGAPPAEDVARSPLRDRTYLTVTALNAVMAMHMGLFAVGVPLWVTTATAAPPVVVAGLLALNTVLVVLLQVRAARGTDDVLVAGRLVRRAGVAIALGCGLFASAGPAGPLVATTVLLLATVVHTFGELWNEAGSWGLAFELADPAAPGAYQGLSQAGIAVGRMLAPLAVTATALEHGTAGWVALALLFAVAGAATAHLARRVARGGATGQAAH